MTAPPSRFGPADRTTFFAEQARHRRRTWRFAVAGAAAVALAGIPLSLILTPILYLISLTLIHLVNLAVPLPAELWTLIERIGRLLPEILAPLDRGLNAGDWSGLDLAALTRLGMLLIAPGMLGMLLLWVWVLALFRRAGPGGVLLAIEARDPRPHDLEERQLVNVLEEMSIAAGMRPPRVKLLDQSAANAAAVGTGPDDATIVVTTGLLSTLDRDETQAVLGHLIGSVGNGDLRIANLVLSVDRTFGLLGAILTAGSAKSAARTLRRSITGLFSRDARAVEEVAELLAQEHSPETTSPSGCRAMLTMPFVLAGATTQLFILLGQWIFFGPILAALWRARRYLADATAVQLTRNPDGMAHAIQRLQRTDVMFPAGAKAGLLFILWPSTSGHRGATTPAGGYHPGSARRLQRLQAQGARLLRFGSGGYPRPGLVARVLGGILTLFIGALMTVALVAMLVVAVMTTTLTLAVMGLSLLVIHGFFTSLPDIIHFFRHDAIPLAKQIGAALSNLIEYLRTRS